MQTLNLARKEYGSIDYEIINFPDGQKHLRILSEINHKDDARVVCRITNGDDLFILMQVADVFNRHCLTWSLDIKYLLAARTDRLFSMGDAHGLNIVMNVLKSLGAKTIDVFEPHNTAQLNNVNVGYMQQINDIDLTYPNIIAFPDDGANKRYSDIYCYGHKVVCDKVRNELTGTLLEFNIKYKSAGVRDGMKMLLIDDLCDGGGTFLGLEPKLRELKPKELYLQVAHAIQLDGLEKVAKVYDKVIISNSYADWDLMILPENVIVIDVLK